MTTSIWDWYFTSALLRAKHSYDSPMAHGLDKRQKASNVRIFGPKRPFVMLFQTFFLKAFMLLFPYDLDFLWENIFLLTSLHRKIEA